MTQAETQLKNAGQRPAGDGGLAVAAGSATALVLATLTGAALTFWHQAACRAGLWNQPVRALRSHCYSDVYTLYFSRGLSHGQIPYLGRPVEYPVLIGAVMQAASWAARSIAGPLAGARTYVDITAVFLVLCAVAGVLATAVLTGRSRRWTALLVALSPALILVAWVNWDLLAMALTTVAMAAWARRRGVAAGVLFGLAVAAKFYPLFLLAALFPLCLRGGRLRAFLVTLASAAVTWLAVNLPVAIVAFGGWSEFYRMNESRPSDYGTVWDVLWLWGWHPGVLVDNVRSGALILLGFALIAVLVLAAPRRPRVPQVFFLVLAVFLLLNKVWSLQYVIWLVPLAVLARPRLWSFLLWQAAEAGHFWVFWPYLVALANPSLPGGIGNGPYVAAVLGRFLAVAVLCALVVRDILRPGADVVRRDGEDDPAGGVLDGAPDAVRLRARIRD